MMNPPIVRRSLILLFGLAVFAPARAEAVTIGGPVPRLIACAIPGTAVAAEICVDLTSALQIPQLPTGEKLITFDVTHLFAGLGLIHVAGFFDPDPTISYTIDTLNLLPTMTYEFLFATPVVAAYYNAATSETILETLASGPIPPATVNPNPAVQSTYLTAYGTRLGVPTTLGVDLGTDECTTATSTTCDYGSTSNSFAPRFFNDFEVLHAFTQTGLNSTTHWSGTVSLTFDPAGPIVPDPNDLGPIAVPEPTTLILLGSAAFGLAIRRWRP